LGEAVCQVFFPRGRATATGAGTDQAESAAMRLELAHDSERCAVQTYRMRIYQTMVAIDGVRSYIDVRADNMSQAFDCALMRAEARNPQSYVEVLTAQELHEPVMSTFGRWRDP
jgi:hypothetical protein